MSKELFEKFNEQANYNLGQRGNLSGVVVAYTKLAKEMGKEDIAMEQIAALPPAESLNNPDMRYSLLPIGLTIGGATYLNQRNKNK